ncbi:MAG TPA: response regulator [bacterium]|nr:response regulator [bacterium]
MARILITDDTKDLCWALTNVLRKKGYDTVSVNNGEACLKILDTENIDLLILDIRMPGMDGLEVLKKVKQIRPGLPVIMITGYATLESAVEAMKLGAFEYITKPFNNNTVLNTVERALKESKFKGREKFILGKITEGLDRKIREKKWRRFLAFFFGLIVLVLFFSGFQKMFLPEISFSAPASNISGLFLDQKNLWSCDWFASMIYKHRMDRRLTIEDQYPLKGIKPAGICRDGDYLWVVEAWKKKIYKFKLNAGQLEIVEEYPTPGITPSAIYFDGENIWSGDSSLGFVYKHDRNFKIVDSFKFAGTNPCSILKREDKLWIADTSSNKIYIYDVGGDIILRRVFVPRIYGKTNYKISGLAGDDKSLWSCSEDSDKIYKHNSLFSRLFPFL